MAPRYPAPCRCTMRRVAEPCSGIWVTDSMLRVAIERYQRSSHASRRHLSSHRGAMESRRRRGGRNMTAGMGVAPHNTPSWYFDVMQSTTWQWEAPTAPGQRKNSRQDFSVPGIYSRLRTWLEQSDAGQVFIQPPQDLPAIDTRFSSIDASMPAVPTPATTHDASEYAQDQDSPHEIERLRVKIAGLSDPHDAAVLNLCKRCGQSLAKRIHLGELSTDEIMAALNPIDRPTRTLLVSTGLVDRATSIIRREVLYGMHLAEQRGLNLMPRKMWVELAALVSEANFFVQPANVALFTLLLRTLPDAYRSLVDSSHTFSAVRAIVDGESFENGSAKLSAMRAGKVSSALGRLSEAEWAELSESMETYLGSQTVSPGQRYNMRRMWLFIQAHNFYTTNEAFTSLYQTFTSAETQASRKANAWLLLLARLTSTGSITRESRTDLYNNFSQASHEWVKALGLLYASKHRQAVLAQMADLLTAMNAKDAFLESVRNASLKTTDIDAIRELTASCNDPRFALQAFEASASSADLHTTSKQWKWTNWTQYLKSITQDKKLDSKLMHVLKRTAPIQGAEDCEANVAFLTALANLYIASPTLSQRQKLRRLEWCAARQREVSGQVSFDLLKAIAEQVTSDLMNGQYGRTARLEWLVRMIDDMLGAEQAAQSLKALRGWRWMIAQNAGRV